MIRTTIQGIDLVFETSEGLFSPQAVDRGTLAMLSQVEFQPSDKVLDLGCGYGVVGILAAKLIGPDKVFMIDNDPAAVDCARLNAGLNGVPQVAVSLSDGFRDFAESHFTRILCNPPYHEDFSVAKHFVHKGFNRLVLGGQMWMVTKRPKWYANKLRAIFGEAERRRTSGYHVFLATKTSFTWAKAERKRSEE